MSNSVWIRTAATLIAFLALPSGVHGVGTTYWDISGAEAIGEGTVEQITVGPLGTLELSPQMEELGALSEYYVWSIVSDGDGNLYVGTGDQGKVFRIDRNGESTLFFDSIELDILSLALDGEGNLYAGTSPDGIIYRIDSEGNARTFFDSPDHYIWCMVFDEKGNLLAGTGEHGKVYKIDSSGEGAVFYDSPETNILTMVWDDSRERLLLGGDGKGLVIALDDDGNASVLFDSPRNEIGDVAVAPDGALYIAAAGTEESPAKNGKNGNGGNVRKGLLYRIDPSGATEQIWESESEYLFTLLPEMDGSVLVGTGNPGKLVRVFPDGGATDLMTLVESQLLTLHRDGETAYVCTGNQGAVYRIGPGKSEEGEFQSESRDVINLARWGMLRWWGESPKGTSVTFSTRTGNTEEVDESWSDWEEIGTGEQGGRVQSPAARFLRWKIDLKGDGQLTPRVDRVRIAYRERNLAPRLVEVTVNQAESSFFSGPADPRPETLHQILSDGTRVEFYPSMINELPQEESNEVWTSSIRTLRWTAADPNGDNLYFDIYYRGSGEKEWKLLDEDLTMSYYSWDSRTMPDGIYRVKIVARDERSNPVASALSGEGISDPIEVDNTAPRLIKLTANRQGEDLQVKGEATDGLSPLLRAEYSLNADRWFPVDPVDEIYDSRDEQFDFTLESPGEGEQTLILRVTDQAGNSVLGKAVIR